MTNILLSKPTLSCDIIDLSVGEATLVRKNLLKYFPSLYDPSILALGGNISINDFEYPSPNGYKPLVDLLEAKYNAPVVIGCGAKQLLGASMYALKKRADLLWMQPIYWALLPSLARAHGLIVDHAEPTKIHNLKHDLENSGYLLLAPNNPDGYCPPYKKLVAIQQWHKDRKIPLIHDGAYYCHSYLPSDYELGPLGDIQILSFSKMLGLSGLRMGAAIIHDKSFYQDIVEYMEMMTVGVSVLSQQFLYAVMQKMKDNPQTAKIFEQANYAELTEAKRMLKTISPKVLEVPNDVEQTNGMFFWGKIINKEAFTKAKIHIVGGEPFGDKTKVRLNLGVGNEVLAECIKRLNEVVA